MPAPLRCVPVCSVVEWTYPDCQVDHFARVAESSLREMFLREPEPDDAAEEIKGEIVEVERTAGLSADTPWHALPDVIVCRGSDARFKPEAD